MVVACARHDQGGFVGDHRQADVGRQDGQAGGHPGKLSGTLFSGGGLQRAAVQECSTGAGCTAPPCTPELRKGPRQGGKGGRGEFGDDKGKEAQLGDRGLQGVWVSPGHAGCRLQQRLSWCRADRAEARLQAPLCSLQSVCSLVCSRGRRACCGTMAAADGISSPPASPAKELPTVSDILAAANMRRLLEAYRNLAPLTIGGPSSTSLEPPGPPLSSRPPHTFPDPRLLRKFAHYPWLLGAQGMPPGLSPALLAKSEDAVRRRHASCDSMVPGGRTGQRLSPSAPVFSSKDRESSRY